MGHEEFEGRSLDALYAMVSSGKPGDLTGVGEILSKVGSEVESIAGALREYIPRVEWEGDAADAFRDWGDGMVLETRRLAEFSKVMSAEMTRAGQALSEAQAAVPAPTGQCFTDPEKEAERLADEKGKREEAINQLNRLSSFYEAASNRMATEPEPNFRPPFDDGGEYYPRPSHGVENAETPRTASGTNAGVLSRAETSEARADYPASTPQAPIRAEGGNADPVRVDIASWPPGASSEAPVHVMPNTPGAEPASNPGSSPSMDGARSGPYVPKDLGKDGSRSPLKGPGNSQGRFAGPGNARSRGISDGITGGTAQRQNLQGTSPRLPRGSVVGGEGQRWPGRPPMGSGSYPGSSPSARQPDGVQEGRRFASRPGGVVGDARALRGRGEFTPGGSGLLRGSGLPGPLPSRAGTRQAETQHPGGTRPDYLVEEEETWSNGARNITPPVID